VPVTGNGSLWNCDKSRIRHSLDTWLTDGGSVVSLTRCIAVKSNEMTAAKRKVATLGSALRRDCARGYGTGVPRIVPWPASPLARELMGCN
jgi:hypothetical protein